MKTVAASAAAAGFRVFLMPIDACKTILQVEGANGLQKLGAKIKTGGIGVLWHGSIGAMSATFVGHYPWFFTYNYLQEALPKVDKKKDGLAMYLGATRSSASARLPSRTPARTRSASSRRPPRRRRFLSATWRR